MVLRSCPVYISSTKTATNMFVDKLFSTMNEKVSKKILIDIDRY